MKNKRQSFGSLFKDLRLQARIATFKEFANLQAWDMTNGILFYSAKSYTAQANGATYTGVIYAPTAQINGGLSNSTLNGGLYSKYVNFNSGTSLTGYQAAGFPVTIYNLPL